MCRSRKDCFPLLSHCLLFFSFFFYSLFLSLALTPFSFFLPLSLSPSRHKGELNLLHMAEGGFFLQQYTWKEEQTNKKSQIEAIITSAMVFWIEHILGKPVKYSQLCLCSHTMKQSSHISLGVKRCTKILFLQRLAKETQRNVYC